MYGKKGRRGERRRVGKNGEELKTGSQRGESKRAKMNDVTVKRYYKIRYHLGIYLITRLLTTEHYLIERVSFVGKGSLASSTSLLEAKIERACDRQGSHQSSTTRREDRKGGRWRSLSISPFIATRYL